MNTENDDDEVKYRNLCIPNQERMQSFINKMNSNPQIWEIYRELLRSFYGNDDRAISHMIYCLNLGMKSRPAHNQSL